MDWPILVIIVLLVGITAQAIKFLVKALTDKNDEVHTMFSYSGMPSSHTALAASLVTVVALHDGLNSGAFAVAFIGGFLIVRDALGLRNYVNKNLRDVEKLVAKLPKNEQEEFTKLDIEVGHTRAEVGVGAVVGVVFTLLYFWVTQSILAL